MKLALSAPHPVKLCFEKQIQLSGERTLSPATTLGHRLDQAMVVSTPMHNQARLRELGKPNNDTL